MQIYTTDYINIDSKVKLLNLKMPTGITVLPYNFENYKTEKDLCYEDSELTLRFMLRDGGINGSSLEDENSSIPIKIDESLDINWIPPIVFISSLILSDNPHLLDITLGIISNFFYEILKNNRGGKIKSKKFEFSIVKYSIGRLSYKKAT
ncbi:hypothetical protein JXQ31_10370 [candidate division KSB1 bacterium]|nr:hypothetical protein [candidate division KSB1 bacterium]